MVEMFSSLSSGLFQVFNWSTFSLMMIGIAVGFVVGILPGLGRADGDGFDAAVCFQNECGRSLCLPSRHDGGDGHDRRYHLRLIRRPGRTDHRFDDCRRSYDGAQR